MPSFTVEGGNVISTLTYNTFTTFNLASQIAAAINPLSVSPSLEATTTTISTAGPATIPAGIVGIVIAPTAPPTTVTGSGAGPGGSGGVESVVAGSSGLTYTGAASSLNYIAIAGGTNAIGLALGSAYQVALTGGNATVNGNGTGTIDVGAATATVEASTAANTIFGSGSDFVVLSSGDFAGLSGPSPTVFGGAGPDTIALTGSTNATFSGTTFGSETVFGGLSNKVFTNGSSLVFVAGPSPETDYIAAPLSPSLAGGNSQITYFGSTSMATIQAGVGNETLNASGSSAPVEFVANLAAGNVSIAAGSGNTTVFGGTGANTVTGGSATDLFAFSNGQGGGSELISNFTASDAVVLNNYGTNQVANALATSAPTVVGGVSGTQITLGDNTKVTFVGTSPTASQVVGFNNGVKST